MTNDLTSLVDFDGADGLRPLAGVIVDENGDLLGTTSNGGANDDGTVFEIFNTSTGYASNPTILVSFDGADGYYPNSVLTFDANGDLLATTEGGGTTEGPDSTGDGTIFEVVSTPTGYSSNPVTLVEFTGSNGQFPYAGLITDEGGDLIGTTERGGASDEGTVFEIINTPTGYAGASITLANFSRPFGDVNSTNGIFPEGVLTVDSNGDLLGTTTSGGVDDLGSVFEIQNTDTEYANIPITLVSFDGSNGAAPTAGLITDANGDLFGTTFMGGTDDDGTVFEITRTAAGFSNTPIVLASFDGTNGDHPLAGLTADGNGDLFGTTTGSGTGNDDGTVFEIVNTNSGYADSPITLANFTGTNGAYPDSGLTITASGELIGTTNAGGTNNDGTVFEVLACYLSDTSIATTSGERAVQLLAIGDRVLTASGEERPIKWIGHRSYDEQSILKHRALRPIRFKAGSLGSGRPRRDLFVSQEHSMFIDGLLIPARCLVNGTTIMVENTLRYLDYYHIELETHDVLLAEGAPSESFLDDSSRYIFQNAQEYHVLYAGEVPSRGRYASRVERGPELERIRQRLGTARMVDVILDDIGIYRFSLPTETLAIRLISGFGHAAGDARRLGVAIGSINVNGIMISLDDSNLQVGFHQLEAGWRWTDGAGILSTEEFQASEVTIEVIAVAPRHRAAA